ncbi:Ldh family oxidoreductase [Breoghania sp.]|uniref:Ldh family oxidoreductase n=1 Tax=Breoghania sp. TaxID=2065378 RepID=UPI0026254C35|nr:Ldh family oxidoreductase [Breoghania sp.]MDJ0933341.1 Ldh family oxidoreductase [Breoghania sp.]
MSETSENRTTLAAETLRAHCQALPEAAGVSAGDAAQTVDVFLQAEMMGEESHGLRLFCQIVERVRADGDKAETKIEILKARPSAEHWDAGRSLGQVTPARAMTRAVEMARETGVGLVWACATAIRLRRPNTIPCSPPMPE